ncbi:MAG TPA: TrkA C-terminal domain-containing protein, partial [Spirochaetota bacterium]|nr:TrkA C-terminal domain-containing protein [Spirochaetota bacterium]
EFTIKEKSPLIGKSLKDIELPKDSLILTVIRDQVNKIPDGNFTLEQGDDVITIAKLDSIKELEEVFLNS